MIVDSIIISINYGDFNKFFLTSILPVNVQHIIKARRRRRSIYVFARAVWEAEPPSKFYTFFVDIPLPYFVENR